MLPLFCPRLAQGLVQGIHSPARSCLGLSRGRMGPELDMDVFDRGELRDQLECQQGARQTAMSQECWSAQL